MISRLGLRVLVIAGFISCGAIVLAAYVKDTSLSLLAALLFAAVIVVAGVIFNIQNFFFPSRRISNAPVEFSRLNASLMALTYCWGALSLLGVYTLSGLWWWHSWQYGGAMFAISIALSFYVRAMGRPGHVLGKPRLLDAGAALSFLQGLGGVGALLFLFHTHKLAKLNVDWPANHVFLAGGIAISVVSFLASATYLFVRARG